MKRFVASLMLATLVACAVASIMLRPVRADIVVFTAQLLASNETPPVTNADLNASGSAIVTLNTADNSIRFDVSVNTLGASSIILSHIHEAAAGVAGPVRIDSGLTPGTALPVVNGSVSFTRNGTYTPASDTAGIVSRLLANPAGFYFNVHSNLNPGGAVRGQLVRAQDAGGGGAAPTLSQWGAILMTLLIVATGVFFLLGRTQMATEGKEVFGAVSGSSIDWRLFGKVALGVEFIVGVALLALSSGPVDVIGALTSGGLVAFIIYLLAGAARRR